MFSFPKNLLLSKRWEAVKKKKKTTLFICISQVIDMVRRYRVHKITFEGLMKSAAFALDSLPSNLLHLALRLSGKKPLYVVCAMSSLPCIAIVLQTFVFCLNLGHDLMFK